MKNEKHIEKLDAALKDAMNVADYVCESLSELQSSATEIAFELFASRGLKITDEQATIFIDRFGADGGYPVLSFLHSVERLKRCSRAQLQNWIDLGEDAVIRFFNFN